MTASSLRQEIFDEWDLRCSYCKSPSWIQGTEATLEHIMPQSLGGLDSRENLCIACWDCNRIKRNLFIVPDPQTGTMVHLFHPNKQLWETHFRWSADGLRIVGLTPIGRATISVLRLNRDVLVESRKFWIQGGWHPPN